MKIYWRLFCTLNGFDAKNLKFLQQLIYIMSKEEKIQEYTRKITIELHGELTKDTMDMLETKPVEEKPPDRKLMFSMLIHF